MIQTDKITDESIRLFCIMCWEGQGRVPNEMKRLVEEYIIKDEGVKQLLALTYDPLIKFNIKVPHDELTVDYSRMQTEYGNAEQLVNLLTALYTKTVTKRQEKIDFVWDYIRAYGYHLVLILRKSLDLGFATKSAQQLGIISAHSPQKGVVLKDMDKLHYPTVAEYKYNGSRLSISLDGSTGKIVCRLRQGNIVSIPLLEDALHLNAKHWAGMTIDGELVKLDLHEDGTPKVNMLLIKGGISEEHRIELSGKITSATSTNSSLSMEGLHFVVYDILETANFVSANPTINSYSFRRQDLSNRIDASSEGFQRLISLSSAWEIRHETDLKNVMKLIKEIGGEGVMIKHPTSTYDYKKNSQWHKLKHMNEADFRIVGFKNHTRNDRWIGSLECQAYIDGKKVSVMVGSGLNDADRPVARYEDYHNKIVMITYMDVVQSDGKYSVTNPRIVKDKVSRSLLEVLRPDGTEVNY